MSVDIPEAALAAADHVLGDTLAKLTLLEYGDYGCPAFIQAEPLMQHLVDTPQRIQEHRSAGERSGLRATPAFFLNGKAVDVSFGVAKLDVAVQAALKMV